MKLTHQSVALAGLLALALAISGCNAMRSMTSSGSSGSSGTTSESGHESGKTMSDGPSGSGSSGSSGTSGAEGSSGDPSTSGVPETEVIQDDSGSAGASGMAGATGSGTAGMQEGHGERAATGGVTIAKNVPNSTVLAIEIMPASGGISEGDASMGTSGAAGATGSTTASPSYRVTVRMDDGSTQVLTHSATPDFRSGDRITVTGGAIHR